MVPHLLDSAPAEWAPTGSEEGLGGQRQRLKSGSMMGENWGLVKLLLYEVPVSVCSILVIAQWFPMTQTLHALGAAERPNPSFENGM